MKKIIILLIIFNLFSLNQILFAQSFAGAEGYSSQYNDYLYDYMHYNGDEYWLFKRFAFNYLSDSTFVSMIKIPGKSEKLLGTEFSNLKFAHDDNANIYIAGIYTPNLIDTSYLFVTKLNINGDQIWINYYEKNSNSANIFINGSDLYIHDNSFLFKLNLNGILIWKKQLSGIIKLSKNTFCNIQVLNKIHNQIFNYDYCNALLFQKIDTSGNQVFQKIINTSNSGNTEISTNISFHILNNKIFLSNSYWGEINTDPATSNQVFVNYNTIPYGPFGNKPMYNNYLAVYDTVGNLIISNSKINYPKLLYSCTDSAGSLYFSGSAINNTDYNLKSASVININASANQMSFLAKYTTNLNYLWAINLTGSIKYIDTSHYVFDGLEKLDIAGDYNGTINLNFESPDQITFTSSGYDLFLANYIYLNASNTIGIFTNINNYNNWKIYPNPCKELLRIETKEFKDAQIEIFDITGKLRLSELIINKSDYRYIDVSDFENGYYIIRLKSDEKISTQKLIISK
ncbi:MAG: T9SS type A sorting domain-containing protein [Bacteroidetes bacterium]|nr:T9SS type A sorting domain-containing protein [Bacteroidota bacterium]